MNGITRLEPEWRDFDVEHRPILPHHLIRSTHHARWRFQGAPRGILVRFERRDDWLLSYDARALHFLRVIEGISDNPVAAYQLNRFRSQVRDSHSVLKDPDGRLRMFRHIARKNFNADIVRDGFGHRS